MTLISCPHCGDSLAPGEVEAGLSLVCRDCDDVDPERKDADPSDEPPETAHWMDPPPPEVTSR